MLKSLSIDITYAWYKCVYEYKLDCVTGTMLAYGRHSVSVDLEIVCLFTE